MGIGSVGYLVLLLLKGAVYESQGFGKEDLRQMQGYSP
jgi:hypothetical protein